jgi:hypothetical protein
MHYMVIFLLQSNLSTRCTTGLATAPKFVEFVVWKIASPGMQVYSHPNTTKWRPQRVWVSTPRPIPSICILLFWQQNEEFAEIEIQGKPPYAFKCSPVLLYEKRCCTICYHPKQTNLSETKSLRKRKRQ